MSLRVYHRSRVARLPECGPRLAREETRLMPRTRDTRITGYEPLLSPAALLYELPLGDAPADTVERTRAEVRAALDYAGRLAALRDEHRADLLIVMRVYFEKPRTVTGWKGLINDPDMDGGH